MVETGPILRSFSKTTLRHKDLAHTLLELLWEQHPSINPKLKGVWSLLLFAATFSHMYCFRNLHRAYTE